MPFNNNFILDMIKVWKYVFEKIDISINFLKDVETSLFSIICIY